MTLAQASSTASSRFDISGSSSCAWRPTAVTNSRISDRFSVDEGTCRVNFLSMEGIIECSPDRRGAAREQAAHRLVQYRRYGAARVSERLIDYGASRGASSSSGVEMLKSGLLIVEHFKNVLEAQNLERVSDLGREAANLDVAAVVAHLFDEAHEDAQTCGRDVVELFTVDHDAKAPRVNRLLNRVLELGRGVGVHKALERDD